jgi:general secretion pathway protein A
VKKLFLILLTGEIFTPAVAGVIYDYCEGLLRKVNKLATACLMAAAGQTNKLIDDHLVRVVIESEFEG